MIVFDIETGGLPEEKLRRFYKEKTAEEFAASCDKRWKPETVAEKFAEYQKSGFAEFADRAALSPVTGQVLVIGVLAPAKNKYLLLEGDEHSVLTAWWQQFAKMVDQNREMIGHNIYGFDLPFLVKRSRILKIDVPGAVYQVSGRYVNWHKLFIDTRLAWQMGDFQCESSLDHVSRAFECGEKPDDCSGADFARLYNGTPEEREKAKQYLLNDLKMTAGVADALGVC